MAGLVVAAAQAASIRGDLIGNVSEHLRLIGAAASAGVDLIVFPELSLTGYELDLAAELQLRPDDPRIKPLRDAAEEHDMNVLAGGPGVSGLEKPYLGAFLFSPEPALFYAKIHVHESEREYFAAGGESCVVPVRGVPVGVAICADTSFSSHPAEAAESGAELYVASVMKTESEYGAHANRLRRYAARHGMGVLTANHAGSTAGAESAGKSAFWDERGKLVVRAGSSGTALVIARQDDGNWIGEVITDP